MEEEATNAMNLDLNLGLSPESGTLAADALNLDHWVDDSIMRIREAVRLRARQRRRWRQLQVPHEQQTPFVDLDQLMGNSGNLGVLQSGEGSVAAEERTNEVPKACENNNGLVEDEVSGKKEDIEKGNGNDGSFFDCNICFDLASDPVVTCCGHLFCWPCLYRWLHVHSEANECPVCKGEVSSMNLVPIYGRGTNSHMTEDDANSEVPVRPHARRVESMRQTIPRNALNVTVEEMIRRLGSRFDLRNLSTAHDANAARETLDRNSNFLNRIITSRGMQSEQNPVVPPDDMVDLTQSGTSSSLAQAAADSRRVHSMLLRRSQSHAHRSAAASLSAMLSSAEGRLAEVYTRSNPVRMSDEQAQPVDDRDSFSSIAAMINSESQMDTNVEIDSMVSLSTSTSRRRTTASRGSDIDSGDSHPPRRRRLN